MKSRTSFFNEAILRKNITRFAPIWGIYLVLGVLITLFLDTYSYEVRASQFASMIGMAIIPMTVINFCYAALCAWLLFGDLHKTRMCYSLHAMPMRREGWFLTHVISGLAFSLLPNLVVTVIMLIKCGVYFFAPLAWLLGSTLQFVCFFGIAVLSMHITGKHVAAAGIYLLINFFSLLAYSMAELYLGQFWPGVVIPQDPFECFVPTSQLITMYMDTHYDNLTGILQPEWVNFGIGFLWAGVGLVALVLALLIYRKRDLESAGDFISLRPAAPVVLVIYTVVVGGVLWAMFYYNFAVLLIGLAIGFFTCKMMLQRTLKVFGKKNFLGYGIVTVCVLLTIGLAKLDPLGLTRWVPEADRIESVSVGRSGYSFMSRGSGITLEDPEDLELVQNIHRFAVANCLDETDSVNEYPSDVEAIGIYIRYKLKNGTVRDRRYRIPIDGEGGKLMQRLHCQPEYLFEGHVSDAQDLLDKAARIDLFVPEVEDVQLISDQEGLIRALEKDWTDLTLAQTWNFHRNDESVGDLEFLLRSGNGDWYVNLTIYDSNTHTIGWLKANGYLP